MENKTNYDLTICYSGGLDSVISYIYAKSKGYNPLCLFIDMDHEYAEKERISMKRVKTYFDEHNISFNPDVKILKIAGLIPLLESRLSNQIIPSRNVMLATIGSMFSPRVWINSLDGEQLGKEHDKSVRFFDDTTKLLSFTNEFFQPETIIESPFASWSKAETIKWALEYGVPVEALALTSSCYHPTKEKCGVCLTCYKRYTSFLLNGYIESGYDDFPIRSDYSKELDIHIPEAKKKNDFTRFTPKRIEEYYKIKNIISTATCLKII